MRHPRTTRQITPHPARGASALAPLQGASTFPSEPGVTRCVTPGYVLGPLRGNVVARGGIGWDTRFHIQLVLNSARLLPFLSFTALVATSIRVFSDGDRSHKLRARRGA